MITVKGEAGVLNENGRVLVTAPENSESVVVMHKTEGSDSEVSIELKDGAKMTFITIQDLPDDEVNKEIRSSSLGRNSKLKCIDYCLGCKSASTKITDDLNADGAEIKHVSLFFGSKEQEFSYDVEVNHNAPRTKSRILTNGALDGVASMDSKAKIKINSGAVNSSASQKDNILLLSKSAKADSLPQLEIGEEDVTCSHGSAIGRINPSQLFYLMARGLTEAEAKRKIVAAFLEPVISELKEDSMVCGLKESVAKKLEVMSNGY